MTECYFTPKKDTTSATICDNCGLEKMLHTIGEGVKVNKVIIISDAEIEHQIEVDDDEDAMWDNMYDEDDFEACSICDLPDACADFGCAVKAGLHKPNDW